VKPQLFVAPLLFAVASIALLARLDAGPQVSRPSRTFKVATWNIRSGMGIRGFTNTGWNDDTINCDDPTRPVNAWARGLPQQQLRRLADTPAIVAVALQEAWNCASPSRVNAVLGFKAITREYEGVALAARYGFSEPVSYRRIDDVNNRWLVGGGVCLDAACSSSVPIYSTHWGGPQTAFPTQARRTVAALRGMPPHLFMGDLNVYRLDRWNPWSPCAATEGASKTAALAIVETAGYDDAWRTTRGTEGWTGMLSRRGCGRPHGNAFKRIDYVFSSGLPPVSATRFGKGAPGADAPSDHAGVIAEFEWPAGVRR
jgi:endonuclease/exonuclease/phosphatase family metal-dependent hydrolase